MKSANHVVQRQFEFEPDPGNSDLEQLNPPPDPKSFFVSALAPWFGSNRSLGKQVGAFLADSVSVGIPFSGGLSEVPHIKARTIVVNDLHRTLINLASVVSDEHLGPMLYRRLRRKILHPDELESVQERCAKLELLLEKNPEQHEELKLDLAESYFVAVWMGRNGVSGTDSELDASLSIRWNANGGDSAKRYQNAVRSLNLWRRTLRRATFSTLDVFEFLEKCKDLPKHAVYCDQPFPGPGDRYKYKFSDEQTVALSRRLLDFQETKVVCRFYDHPLIRSCYPESDWEWHRYKGKKQTNAIADEVLLVRKATP
jgi:hypothetical protein